MDENGNVMQNGGKHYQKKSADPKRTECKWLTSLANRLFGGCKCRNENCLQKTSRDHWLKSYGLVKSGDMPPDLREMHLLYGYRPIPSSFSYCMRSIFYPTNETLNFWTHFIALFFLANRFYMIFMHNLRGPLSDPLYYPLWVYAFGSCLMLIGSCIAHVFCSYSRNVRETCWFCDYASITLSSLGSSIVYHNYICPYECMGWPIRNYTTILGVFGVIGHGACCYSRRMTSSVRYVLRSSVFVFLYIGSSIPCAYKFFIGFLMDFDHDLVGNSHKMQDIRCNLDTTNFLPVFALVTLFCSLTVLFNVSKIPEKWFPGTFDIVGHSHQWMHITIALAFYTQTYMIEGPIRTAEILISEGSLTTEELVITWSDTIGTMAFVALSCMFISFLMSKESIVAREKKCT